MEVRNEKHNYNNRFTPGFPVYSLFNTRLCLLMDAGIGSDFSIEAKNPCDQWTRELAAQVEAKATSLCRVLFTGTRGI